MSILDRIKALQVRRAKNNRSKYTFIESLIFKVPLLTFVALLYGMLGWTIYVSFANWKGTKPNFEFAGFKWYQLLVNLDRFQADIVNRY